MNNLIVDGIEVLKIINEPILIVLILVIFCLMFFIFKVIKQAETRERQYFRMVVALTGEVAKSTNALVKLTSLIEIFIGHKRRRDD